MHFLKALELGCVNFEEDWIGWHSIAGYYLRKGDYARARDAYLKVLKFDTSRQPIIAGGTLKSLSRIALLEKDIGKAIKYAEKALDAEGICDEDVCEATYFLGKALAIKATDLWQTGNYDKKELKGLIYRSLTKLRSSLSTCSKTGAQFVRIFEMPLPKT